MKFIEVLKVEVHLEGEARLGGISIARSTCAGRKSRFIESAGNAARSFSNVERAISNCLVCIVDLLI